MLLTLGTIRYCPSHFSDLLSSFHALFPLSPHHFHLMFSSSVLPSQPSFIHSVNIFSSQLRTLLAYPMLLSLLVVSMPYRLPTYWTPPRGMLGTVSHFSSLFSLAFLSPFTLHSSHYHRFSAHTFFVSALSLSLRLILPSYTNDSFSFSFSFLLLFSRSLQSTPGVMDHSRHRPSNPSLFRRGFGHFPLWQLHPYMCDSVCISTYDSETRSVETKAGSDIGTSKKFFTHLSSRKIRYVD